MTRPGASCLVSKLSHYIDLDDEDRERLARFEEEEERFADQSEIYWEGDATEHLHVVKSGWLYGYTDMPDGRRQIVRLHHPGDILGLADIAFPCATSNLRCCTDVILCPFPKSKLDLIFTDAPRIAALLFTMAAREQVLLIDTLKAMGRMSARERIAYLLLDLLSKLRITDSDMGARFRLPLTQTEIGDVLGLTNVYVSKTMSLLEAEGLIARSGDAVQILDEPALVRICDFVDRYADMDTSWFPAKSPRR